MAKELRDRYNYMYLRTCTKYKNYQLHVRTAILLLD